MHFKSNLQRFIVLFLLILGLTAVLHAENIQNLPASESTLDFSGQEQVVHQAATRGTYVGDLKLYVIEPDGRWDDSQSSPFEMAFLDFAFDSVLNLTVDEEFNRYIDWTPNITHVTEDNVMVVAVLYDRNAGYPASSDTGVGTDFPFTAYYPDAVVGCVPGEVDTAGAGGGYTHTVFLEDHSTTW